MRIVIWCLGLALVLPAALGAQQDRFDRLAQVLPPEIAGQVLQDVEAARAQGLPVDAVANLALEGVAKGRSPQVVLDALQGLLTDMGRARAALQVRGGAAVAGDIEAATAAMRMGVDGGAVSDLARSQASGRSIAVPLLVLGGLTERGLPPDEALATVRDRLAAGAGDAQLLGEFPGVARGLARGLPPGQTGPALAAGLAGFHVPVAGISVPVGPQGKRPDHLPGRGRGGPHGGM